MSGLRILYVTPYVPSPIRVRPYNLIKALAARGHRLRVLALATTPQEREDAARLRALGLVVETAPHGLQRALAGAARGALAGWPLQAACTRSPALLDALGQALAGDAVDLVHVEHLRGACYGSRCSDRPAVWDAVDCISLLLERARALAPGWKWRLAARLELARTRRYEARAAAGYARVLVSSPEDRGALCALGAPAERLVVLTNGVDLEYFRPQDGTREPDSVVFTGKMSYHANVAACIDLATQVMPRLWRERPGVRLRIVGQDPPPAVRRLARDGRVVVTGGVSDLRPYLARASVAVCPLRYGVGVQNKVLEAMAMGTPVVASPQACRALSAEAGEHLLVGGDAEALARHVQGLLESPVLAAALGQAGRRYVVAHHDWRAVAARLESIYEEVMARWPA